MLDYTNISQGQGSSSSSPSLSDNPNKILLGIDLDYAHFKSHKQKTVEWIGEKQFWLDLYRDVINFAAQHQFEIIFAIISKKPTFDDIAVEAAESFAHFLQKANPHMFLQHDSKKWCLVNCHGTLRYECLTANKHMTNIHADDALSHIMLLRGEDSKANAILQLATFYGIPAHRCVMIDDTPDVLMDVGHHGIHPISLTCFHNEIIDLELLDNVNYVTKHLMLTKERLMTKFGALVKTEFSLPTSIHLQPVAMEQRLCELLTRFELDEAHGSESDPLALELISMISSRSNPLAPQPPIQDTSLALELLSSSPTLRNV